MTHPRIFSSLFLHVVSLLGLSALFAQASGLGVHSAGQVAGGGDSETLRLIDIAKSIHRLQTNEDFMTRWLRGLPQMPDNHSPESREWSNSFAVCAIMRDENVTDVTEWLRYYKWLGADHVFLTDNNSSNSEYILNTLTAAFPADFLTVRQDMTPKAQLKAYAWCAEEQRLKYNWIAFVDMDEYLVLRGEHAADPITGQPPNLKAFLNRYKMQPGLSVNWIAVGPSGRDTRPEQGGVLPHYTECVPEADRHVKTITNTWFLEGVALHPHNFHFRGGEGSVNEEMIKLEEVWMPLPKNIQRNQWKGKECQEALQLDSPQLRDHCYKTAEPLFRKGTVERVALFHYATKSAEDFKHKMARGSGMSLKAKNFDYYNEILKKQRDEPICKEPSLLFDACCSEEGVARQARAAAAAAAAAAQASLDLGDSLALHRQSDRLDGGYYMSVQYFTKHVSQRTVVQPGPLLPAASVARAFVMLLSILMVTFVALVAMTVLLFNRRAQNRAIGRLKARY